MKARRRSLPDGRVAPFCGRVFTYRTAGGRAWRASPQQIAAVNAVAAGAPLTMVVVTIIPEAVESGQKLTRVLVVFGLLVAFSLSHMALIRQRRRTRANCTQ